MTPEERDELRRDLEAAGCHRLGSRVDYFDDAITAELRSLLRREDRFRHMADKEDGGCVSVGGLMHRMAGKTAVLESLPRRQHARRCGMRAFLPGDVAQMPWDIPDCPYWQPVYREAWYRGWFHNAAMYLFMKAEVSDAGE